MSQASNIKAVVAKVEQSIEELSKQIRETRGAVERLAEETKTRLDGSLGQVGALAKEIHQEIDTFGEQRRLVESQLTAEVDRAKQLSALKDLEDAVHVVVETLEELTGKVEISHLIEAVQKLEAQQKAGSGGNR
jgi:septation ring formation regulator EzrA